MDFVKQAQGALGGGQQQQQGQQAGQAGGATGQQDALDKGVGGVMGHFGQGGNAQTTERVSDGVRSAYKSATGKDVPIQDKQ